MKHLTKILDNGLKIVVVETKEFKPVQGIVLVNAGAAYETKDNNGISHVVEHLAMKGNKKYPNIDKFDQETERLGCSYNGGTSQVYVEFDMTIPADQLDFLIDHLYQVSFEATFPEKRINTELKAITDEIHMYESDPYRKFHDFDSKARYKKGNVPLPLPGKKNVVSKMNRDQIVNWYERMMNPENMTICIGGNLDTDETLKKIEKKFGSIKNRKNSLNIESMNFYEYDKKTVQTQVDTSTKEAIGEISFKGLLFNEALLIERYALIGLKSIVANLRNSVLYKHLRSEKGLLYSIGAYSGLGKFSPGHFDIHFTTSDNKLTPVYKYIFKEIENIVNNGVDEEIFQISKERHINILKMGHASLNSIVNWYGYGMFDEGRVVTIDEAIETAESVDIDLVNRIAKQIFDYEYINVVSRVHNPKYKKELNKFKNYI